jgi:chromo domain-containing protein 1
MWVGLFYTTVGDWDGSAQAALADRHPWIVIYRLRSSATSSPAELLIWDVGAPGRVPRERPRLHDLLPMQRHLVEVQRIPRAGDSFVDVNRVWIGGGNVPEAARHLKHPLDKTAKTLATFTKEPQQYLPTDTQALLDGGWKIVDLSDAVPIADTDEFRHAPSKPHHAPPPPPPARVEFPKKPTDERKQERMIFHPPRSAEGRAGKPSRCTNDMYAAALNTRQKQPHAENFNMTYRPTLEWYRDLEAEGRDYAHVWVGEWDKVFDVFDVPERKKEQQQPRPSADSMAMDLEE